MIDRIDISGSLPPGEVQRAVERSWSDSEYCTPQSPVMVVAHFKIGEARRAEAVTVTGATKTINACIAAVLGQIRTDEAPDVDDAEVTVQISFVVKT